MTFGNLCLFASVRNVRKENYIFAEVEAVRTSLLVLRIFRLSKKSMLVGMTMSPLQS